MKKLFIITVICCSSLFTKAQLIDTIQKAITRKATFAFSFTSRNSFITTYSAYIFGYSVGVTFDKKLTIGGGFNALNSIITKDKTIDGITVKEDLNFVYFSYFVQYAINLTKHWKLYIMPFCVGVGGSSYQYTYKLTYNIEDSYTVVPYEPQVELDYNFNRWLGLYTQVGYRFMILNNPTIPQNFNSPIYSYGVLFSPFEFLAAIFPHSKAEKAVENE
ncbi:MAG TPA: hypothetical protein VN922_20460 [Bacteroidia bacterium]|nr:hypothetical protein [Bacteroidia bacterium]